MPDSILGLGTVTARLRGPQPGVREVSSEAIAGWGSEGCVVGISERHVVSEEPWGFWGGPLGDDRPGGKQVVAIRGATVLLECKVRGEWGDSQDEPGGWAAARPALASLALRGIP